MVKNMTLAGVCCRGAEGQKVLTEQFSGVAVYPDSEAMAAHERDYDAVIVSYEQFERLPISADFARELYEEQINSIIRAIEEAKADKGEKSLSIKDLETYQGNQHTCGNTEEGCDYI